jgi:hypothetical protein
MALFTVIENFTLLNLTFPFIYHPNTFLLQFSYVYIIYIDMIKQVLFCKVNC